MQRELSAILGADVAGIPRGRIGAPEEVSGLGFFLASEEGACLTGKVPRIDGGQFIGGAREGIGSTSPRTFPGFLEVSDGFCNQVDRGDGGQIHQGRHLGQAYQERTDWHTHRPPGFD